METRTGCRRVRHSRRKRRATGLSHLRLRPHPLTLPTGTIWVANQPGIPHIIVRAEMDQTITTTNSDGKKETTRPYWEHNISAINEPVVIEPPE